MRGCSVPGASCARPLLAPWQAQQALFGIICPSLDTQPPSNMADYPKTVEDIFEDLKQRRAGLLTALTDEVEEFYKQCDPEKENLCLYGEREGTWIVALPAEEVPPELPEPCLGINFARDGMARKDWLALVAVHSDAWLVSVAFFYAVRLDAQGRAKLFSLINKMPTLFEVVTGKSSKTKSSSSVPLKRKKPENNTGTAKASDHPSPTGRLLTDKDIGLNLRGRRAELYWPDDQLWYLVEIVNVNMRSKSARIVYTSGENEELDLDEIARDGHMCLLAG